MNLAKENFIRTKLVSYLKKIKPTAVPAWGKMNFQQMVEHLAREGFAVSSGKIQFEEITTPSHLLPKFKEFLMSDKPFRENTVNPLMPNEPLTPMFNTPESSINYLQEEIIYFFEVFEANTQLITRNPHFGDLNFDENVQLIYKHSLHHLKQFGIAPLI